MRFSFREANSSGCIPLIFCACPCCLAGKTISLFYTTSLSPSALIHGHIFHVDIINFPEICPGGIQYHMLACDEFSTHVHSFAMKTKSNIDIIVAFTSLVSYFKQFGHEVKFINSDHESALIRPPHILTHKVFNTISSHHMNKKSNSDYQFEISISSGKFKVQATN